MRDYSYDKLELFMTGAMKDAYACEHALLALLARDGKRVVFPTVSHMGGVLQLRALVRATVEVGELAEQFAAQ